MIRPNNIESYPDIDLKLGIKSSLPNVKSTLALLILIWKSAGYPATISYSSKSGDGICINDEVSEKLIKYASPVYNTTGLDDKKFMDLLNNNQMLKSQLEALIVAFELVWKVAKIGFQDVTKAASAERTGGKRYPKQLSYTINMDVIQSIITSNEDGYKNVLLKWVGVNTLADAKLEKTLSDILTILSEGAVFKLSDGGKDVVFNQNEIYQKLLESKETVDVNGDKEAKGSLRILKSLLSDGLNPYLKYSAGSVSVVSERDKNLESYQKRVDTFLSLSTTKVVGIDELEYNTENKNISIVAEENAEYFTDPYKIAAKVIRDYVSSTGYEFDVSKEIISTLHQEFNDKFSPKVLAKISDKQLLKSIFYTAESTNDSLCYWLEFHAQNKKCFGSIAGGSSYKFGLYQRKSDSVWVTGSPTKPEELSEEEAIQIGCEIRDYLITGSEIIESFGQLNTVEEYEKLDDALNTAIGKYASFAWVHKYYCMLYPTKLVTWHSNDWQNHILYAYGIKPSEKYYSRSGQLSIIANYAKMSGPVFSHASYDRFGAIKQFCRIGTSDGTTNYFSEWKNNHSVSIGWDGIDSLDNYIQGDDVNRKAIADKLGEVYYSTDPRTASRKASELATFYRTTKNTVFVAMDGESLFALGDGVGVYSFDESKKFAHCKSVVWHNCFSMEDRLPNKSEGLRTSCVTLSDSDNLLYLYHKYYFETDEIEGEKEVEENVTIKRSPRADIQHPLNQIIFGAPGTGKTYSSAEYALAIIEKRPINSSKTTPEERKNLMENYESYVENGQITFTTFHQSYGYEEFIQGIRPDSTSGTINFKKADGVFKKIADKALKDDVKNYVIIIDEINRGNISKIFGELITLIEEDKRCGEVNQLMITLPLGDKFTVPNNLYIIGTMNSADKSISLIDTALRRRFAFVEMAPDASVVEDETLRKVLIALNGYLKKELRSTDLLIGHSFFIGKSSDDLENIMNRNIIPLLYEYFYDDEGKVKKALECLKDTNYMIDGEYRGRIRIQKKV